MLSTPDFPRPITPFTASSSPPSLSLFLPLPPCLSLPPSFSVNSPQATFPDSIKSTGLFGQSWAANRFSHCGREQSMWVWRRRVWFLLMLKMDSLCRIQRGMEAQWVWDILKMFKGRKQMRPKKKWDSLRDGEKKLSFQVAQASSEWQKIITFSFKSRFSIGILLEKNEKKKEKGRRRQRVGGS